MKTLGIVVMVVVCLSVSSTLMAWTQFKDGGVHNISTTINDDVWVDYQAPGMKTTVNLIVGETSTGDIPNPFRMKGFNDSTINVSGGYIDYELYTYDQTRVTVSLGTVYQLFTNGNSQVTVSGGSVFEMISASDNASVTLSSGSSSTISANGNNHITISGGLVRQLYLGGGSQTNITGGKNITFSSYDHSQVTISGGEINGSFHTGGDSQVVISGGAVTTGLSIDANSQLWVFGSNFAIDGIPISSGKITSIFGNVLSNEPFRILTGTFANGSTINNRFQIGNSATINLVADSPVPEPSSILALSGGVVGIFSFRRRR